MAKTKTQYICQSCGANSPKWLGKCPQCHAWNSMEESIVETASKSVRQNPVGTDTQKLFKLKEVAPEKHHRIASRIGELDRVLGGGMMPGSVIIDIVLIDTMEMNGTVKDTLSTKYFTVFLNDTILADRIYRSWTSEVYLENYIKTIEIEKPVIKEV
ncbi:MAG: hypothetical protein R6U85_13870, partial [Salinivirgaceae bacterium]